MNLKKQSLNNRVENLQTAFLQANQETLEQVADLASVPKKTGKKVGEIYNIWNNNFKNGPFLDFRNKKS